MLHWFRLPRNVVCGHYALITPTWKGFQHGHTASGARPLASNTDRRGPCGPGRTRANQGEERCLRGPRHVARSVGGRRRGARKDALVELLQPRDVALPREELAHALPSRGAHPLAQVRVREESRDGRGQALVVAALDQDAGLAIDHHLG